MAFSLTNKQMKAQEVLASEARHCLLYGGSRCVAGDTVLDGDGRTFEELAAIGQPVVVQTSHGKQLVDAPFLKGSTALLEFDLDNGRSVTVTPDHLFWDGRKWKGDQTGR